MSALRELTEVSEVLHRDQHTQHAARTGFTATQLVASYRRFARLVPSPKFWQQICRDADDDAVLACALSTRANLIVTGNKDLLVLHPWRDIRILNPAAALRFIGSG